MATGSLATVIEKLTEEGYTDTCRTEDDGIRFARCGQVYAPEDLKVDQVIRCEGTSAPDEEVMLFALQSPDGQHKATFSSPHGVDCDPLDADAVQRFRVPPHVSATHPGASRDGHAAP